MIACFRFETEFHFEYTSYYRKYLKIDPYILIYTYIAQNEYKNAET